MKKQEETKALLTSTEAAALLGVHPNSLRSWDKSGRLNPIRFATNGRRYYRKEDLEKLLNK